MQEYYVVKVQVLNVQVKFLPVASSRSAAYLLNLVAAHVQLGHGHWFWMSFFWRAPSLLGA